MKKSLLLMAVLAASKIVYSQEFIVNNITYEVTSSTTVKTKDYNMAGGTVVNIPATVTNNLTNYSVTAIGVSSFSENQISSVTIPNSVTSIGSFSFYFNELATITIPDSVTALGAGAFQLNYITSFTLPNGITSISDFLFSNNRLSSITIPNTVSSIGKNAFTANQLTNITIPAAVESIGDYSFKDNFLTTITSLATTPPIITTGAMNGPFNNDRTDIDLTIPAETTGVYVTNTGALWTGFKSVKEDTALSSYDFESDNNITITTSIDIIKVNFPNKLSLKDYRLYNISGVEVGKGIENEIPTNYLSSGIYILKLDFDKGTFTKKIGIN